MSSLYAFIALASALRLCHESALRQRQERANAIAAWCPASASIQIA
jgi:hypothetical protein